MTTPYDIVSRALKDIGALEAGETASADAAQDALDMLNDMIDQWSNESMMVYNITEIIFPVVPNTTQYTLGNGGTVGATFIGSIAADILTITQVLSGSITLNQFIDGGSIIDGTQIISFLTGAGGVVNAPGTYRINIPQTVASTTIPAYFQKPLGLNSAFVRVNTTSNGVPIQGGGLDYPVSVLGLDQYELIGLKTLNGPWPKAVYYNPGDVLGNLFVWPNPAQGELHLFADTLFPRFTTLSTSIQVPQGYVNAFRWCLAERLMPMYGKSSQTQIQMIMQFASQAKATLKRTNMNPSQVARYDSILNADKAKDAGWILSGGFA